MVYKKFTANLLCIQNEAKLSGVQTYMVDLLYTKEGHCVMILSNSSNRQIKILPMALFKFLKFRFQARFVGVKWRHSYYKIVNKYRYRYGGNTWPVDHSQGSHTFHMHFSMTFPGLFRIKIEIFQDK